MKKKTMKKKTMRMRGGALVRAQEAQEAQEAAIKREWESFLSGDKSGAIERMKEIRLAGETSGVNTQAVNKALEDMIKIKNDKDVLADTAETELRELLNEYKKSNTEFNSSLIKINKFYTDKEETDLLDNDGEEKLKALYEELGIDMVKLGDYLVELGATDTEEEDD